ncbi:phosphatidate cytidylyltransferase [Candidatus Saccharibacteria bacterium]|nr:phosphatidate cytidylyltransferase [Candidatus Saccharibacteria bacterium]
MIAALLLAYFTYDGEYFNLLVLFCLLMALAEESVAEYDISRPKGPSKLRAFPELQVIVLIVAMFSTLTVTHEEVAYLIIVCALSDVGAFMVGKLIGKHKVAFLREISPKKSWEGYIAGLIFPALAIWLTPLFLGIQLQKSMLIYLAMGGLLAEVGDLLGSATKRAFVMKDSNEVLIKYKFFRVLEYPMIGHGGYLDRLDSLSLSLCGYAIIRNLASLL